MRAKPEYFRKQARLSRELAESAPDEELQETLLNMAIRYDRLAAEAEKHQDGPDRGR
jgi:hypothetical protein